MNSSLFIYIVFSYSHQTRSFEQKLRHLLFSESKLAFRIFWFFYQLDIWSWPGLQYIRSERSLSYSATSESTQMSLSHSLTVSVLYSIPDSSACGNLFFFLFLFFFFLNLSHGWQVLELSPYQGNFSYAWDHATIFSRDDKWWKWGFFVCG